MFAAQHGWNAAFWQTQHWCDGRRALFSFRFCSSWLILTHTTGCFLHSSSNPKPKSRLLPEPQPIWPFWSKTNLCVDQANANGNICANVACVCEDLELGNVCRHAAVTPGGLLSELCPFAHTAWLLVAKPDGWEGGRFHLPNISECGKVLKIATPWNATFCGCKPVSVPF